MEGKGKEEKRTKGEKESEKRKREEKAKKGVSSRGSHCHAVCLLPVKVTFPSEI